jgi:hypothetical protein
MDADNCLDFDLLITPLAEGGYRARIVSSPAGVAGSTFTLPFSELEIENLVLRMGQVRSGLRRRASPQSDAAREFGRRLYEAVFDGEVATCWRDSIAEAARQNARLRLRLRLTDAPELFDLPWEYLYDAGADRFLTLSSKTPLVRYLELSGRIDPLPVQPPLRILALIASPHDMEPLDVEREWRNLQAALADLAERNVVQLIRCPSPTLPELQRTLRLQECHIFHFVGHGAYDGKEQDGLLLLEDDQGRSRPVSGRQLGALLHDEGQLRLAVLNACEGGRASRLDPFSGVGQSLLQQGVPAVIAMQFAVTDVAAAIFAHEFYAAVADGYPIDSALAEARKAIFAQSESVEWGTPVLYMSAVEGRVFDLIGRGTPAAPKPAPVVSSAGAISPQPVKFRQPAAATPASTGDHAMSGRRLNGMALILGAVVLVAAAAGLFFWLRNNSSGSLSSPPAISAATVDTNTPVAAEPAPAAPAVAGAGISLAENEPLPSFRYTFNDGDAGDWSGDPADWHVLQDETGNYVYQGSAPPDGYAPSELPNMATMSTWRNYTLHTRLRALRPGNNDDFAELWITTRAPYEEVPGCSYYNTYLDFRSQVVTLAKGGDSEDCPYTRLDSNGLPLLKLGVWHDLVIAMQNDRLQVTVDGSRVISATDSDVDQGYVYFTVSNGALVQFDDVEVYRIDD